MRYSINMPNFGELADPRAVADLAVAAEEAGWDAVFLWDHVYQRWLGDRPIADVWVLLTAAGMVTTRLRLGPMITPVARRRPGKLAREIITLDRLTNGRLTLGVGLGAPIEDEYGGFGDTTEPRVLAERLDEGLAAVVRLQSGEPVTYHGKHVVVEDVTFHPTPVQRPRVPVWVGGNWPNRAPFRRAARWDGTVPVFGDFTDPTPPSPDEVRELMSYVAEHRTTDEPFDLVVGGRSTGDRAKDAEVIGALAEAGGTWWDVRVPFDDTFDRVDTYRRLIEAGPPGA